MSEWIEDVGPKTAALANLITTVLAVGGMIWAAASIKSSVNQLENFRERALAEHQQLQRVQSNHSESISSLQVLQNRLRQDIGRLRDLHEGGNIGNIDRSSGLSACSGWPRVVALPREGTPEPESRRPPEGSRAALPGGKQEGDAQY